MVLLIAGCGLETESVLPEPKVTMVDVEKDSGTDTPVPPTITPVLPTDTTGPENDDARSWGFAQFRIGIDVIVQTEKAQSFIPLQKHIFYPLLKGLPNQNCT
jgi:hypothetical protein